MTRKIMLAGYLADKSTEEIIRTLKERGVLVPLAVVCNGDFPSLARDLGTEFIDEDHLYDPPSLRAIVGALDLPVLAFIRPHYPIILRAMERWIPMGLNLDDRLFLIDALFSYFVRRLREAEIECIAYSTATPHHFWDLVLYHAAEALGVRSIFHSANEFSNRARFTLGLNFRTVPIHGLAPAPAKVHAFVDRFTEKKIDAPWTQLSLAKSSNYRLLPFLFRQFPRVAWFNLKTFFRRSHPSYFYWRGSRAVFGLRIAGKLFANLKEVGFLRRTYFKRAISNVADESLVIYAHFQPEATSHPNGGLYPDARYWVNFIKKLNPRVYYKEHSTTFFYSNQMAEENPVNAHRSLQYFDDLESAGAVLLRPDVSTRRLFDQRCTIFTFTGTVILECIFNRIPIYYTGMAWHGRLPGAERIEVSDGVFLNYFDGSAEHADRLREYFLALDEASFPNLFGWSTGVKSSDCSMTQYADLLGQAVECALEMKTE